jgi:hypothetical protein
VTAPANNRELGGAETAPHPCDPIWELAVHEAGHCLAAHLLGLRVIRGALRPAANRGNVWWRSFGHRHVAAEERDRPTIEADAMVVLAGGAAQWLFNRATLRYDAYEADDRTAVSVLSQLADESAIVAPWREYLRQRAVSLLSPPSAQFQLALLAGRFVERGTLAGEDIHGFLDVVAPCAEEYAQSVGVAELVVLFGHPEFETPLRTLPLSPRTIQRLRRANIISVGQVLWRSVGDLSELKGIGNAELREIWEVFATKGWRLAERSLGDIASASNPAAAVFDRYRRNRPLPLPEPKRRSTRAVKRLSTCGSPLDA